MPNILPVLNPARQKCLKCWSPLPDIGKLLFSLYIFLICECYVIRPLKINGLFLVQNFPKLNARARRQNKKEITKICIFYNSGTNIVIQKGKINLCFFPLFLPESEERERAKDQKQTIYFKRPYTKQHESYKDWVSKLLQNKHVNNAQNPPFRLWPVSAKKSLTWSMFFSLDCDMFLKIGKHLAEKSNPASFTRKKIQAMTNSQSKI